MNLGIIKINNNCIFETIISTYGPTKDPSAAPIGVIFKSAEIFHILMYKGSTTLRNLIFSKCGVVNITFDIELFYKATFKEDIDNLKFKKPLFQRAECVDAPVITSAAVNLEFVVEKIKKKSLKTFMVCRIVKIKENSSALILPYTRGFFAALESIIHSTRIKYLLKEGKNAEADRLIRLIEYYKEVAIRVSPDSIYIKIIENLIKKIGAWRRVSASNNKNTF